MNFKEVRKMDKNYSKRILDLIRTDLITMNGGKNNMRVIFVLMILFFGGLGFLFSPLMGVYVPFLTGAFFVPMMFQNEMKYHSEKMFALLPINRKDLVRSRFIMSFVLYVVSALLFYLLMLLSLKLKPYYFLLGEDAENTDVIRLIAERTGSMTELGLFNLLYFGVFSVGLMTMSGSLRKYFRNKATFESMMSGGIRKATRKEKGYVLLAFAVILFLILNVTDILPVRTALAPAMQLLLQLAQAANGFLLGAVLVTVAVFSAIYKYICTVLEYDEKEL